MLLTPLTHLGRWGTSTRWLQPCRGQPSISWPAPGCIAWSQTCISGWLQQLLRPNSGQSRPSCSSNSSSSGRDQIYMAGVSWGGDGLQGSLRAPAPLAPSSRLPLMERKQLQQQWSGSHGAGRALQLRGWLHQREWPWPEGAAAASAVEEAGARSSGSGVEGAQEGGGG